MDGSKEKICNNFLQNQLIFAEIIAKIDLKFFAKLQTFLQNFCKNLQKLIEAISAKFAKIGYFYIDF